MKQLVQHTTSCNTQNNISGLQGELLTYFNGHIFNPREVSYCSVFNFSFIFFHILEAVLYLSIRNNQLLPDYILCHE